MRTVIASADPDLTVALQFALRRQPSFDVVGSVTTADGLVAVAESSTVDLFIIDAALTLASEVIRVCRRAGPSGAPASVVMLASEDEAVDDADAVVRKGRAPAELLDTLRRIQRERRRTTFGS